MLKKYKKTQQRNGQNWVLGWFWADLDCRFEFYAKNCIV